VIEISIFGGAKFIDFSRLHSGGSCCVFWLLSF